MNDQPEILPWTTHEKKELFHCRVFQVDRLVNESRSTGRKDDFFVIRSPDWVNVVALTPEGEAVLVEQYRHGTHKVTLEIPGGMIDPVDGGPVEAGLRELKEETGYEGEEAVLIGVVAPNPAIQSNVCHTLLVRNVRKVAEPSLDPNEEMRTVVMPLERVGDLLRTGGITHALVVAAFYHLAAWKDPEIKGKLLGE